jgi:hypothetical protein
MRLVPFIIAFVYCITLTPNESNAQYKFDFGFKLGLSNYLGEMGGDEQSRRNFIMDMKMQESRWALAGFARYRVNNFLAINFGGTYARIEGDDALSSNPGRRGRNLSFRNDFGEVYGRGEVYFFNENDVGNRGRYQTDFQAFAFGGIAGIIHGPKALYDGEWVKLRPLKTEGEDYGVVTFGLPVGIGFFFTQKRKHRFGWELSWTTTFTDYMDDASNTYVDGLTGTAAALANRRPELGDIEGIPAEENYGVYVNESQVVVFNKRGDPSHNDSYLFTNFTYSYLMKGYNTFYTQSYGWLGTKKRGVRKVRAKF